MAVLLLALPPLQMLVILTQYDFVEFSGGVVNVLLLTPTGVVVVPLVPSYH